MKRAKPTRQQIRDTEQWTRNASDVAAVKSGCWFDVERAAYAVWWIERICKLYEGSQAGEPLILRGCHECYGDGPSVPSEWDDEAKKICIERARKHAACVAAGHRIDWQYDCTMRVFGWVRWSDHWGEFIRRFRKSKVFIPKKNKKSPTLSAWSLYLTCGDGEPGQHVYLCAKDGEQVRDNIARHAKEMLEQSPELLEECSLNLSTMQITHETTRSTCKPLSSSNVNTQKSKEGLNGSCGVDEVHTVDRAFVKRIDRAGISRKEPLHFEFSTVGDDPDTYGYDEFQRCVAIIAGEKEEQDTFAAVYAAPQDLTDAQLAEDPLKYFRMSNPARGHTVNDEEFLADYQANKDSPADTAILKMYRLNIWQHSTVPWLNMEGWDKGERQFKHEDLHGRECWSALDLAWVSDFAALCLAFPEEGEAMSFLWWFWLPEETARKNAHKMPIAKWKADPRCRLTLTPGARIQFGAIRSQYRQIATEYDIRELAYDDWNAEQTTEEISEGVSDLMGKVIEPATGIPRVNFSQGIATMNEPTKRFEAAVIDGNVWHNGDPLARWMARNATVKPDANGNYKPIKSRDLLKKIDGVVVGIMARARAILGNSYESYYDRDDTEVEAF